MDEPRRSPWSFDPLEVAVGDADAETDPNTRTATPPAAFAAAGSEPSLPTFGVDMSSPTLVATPPPQPVAGLREYLEPRAPSVTPPLPLRISVEPAARGHWRLARAAAVVAAVLLALTLARRPATPQRPTSERAAPAPPTPATVAPRPAPEPPALAAPEVAEPSPAPPPPPPPRRAQRRARPQAQSATMRELATALERRDLGWSELEWIGGEQTEGLRDPARADEAAAALLPIITAWRPERSFVERRARRFRDDLRAARDLDPDLQEALQDQYFRWREQLDRSLGPAGLAALNAEIHQAEDALRRRRGRGQP